MRMASPELGEEQVDALVGERLFRIARYLIQHGCGSRTVSHHGDIVCQIVRFLSVHRLPSFAEVWRYLSARTTPTTVPVSMVGVVRAHDPAERTGIIRA